MLVAKSVKSASDAAGDLHTVPAKLCDDHLFVWCIQYKDPMLFAFSTDLITILKRLVENIHNGLRVIVGRDAIDRQGPTFCAFMNEHQLAS